MRGFVSNLISVTTGNIFGGGFIVAIVYWFIYRRPKTVQGGVIVRRVLGFLMGSTVYPDSRDRR
jgi:hypothetical protein